MKKAKLRLLSATRRWLGGALALVAAIAVAGGCQAIAPALTGPEAATSRLSVLVRVPEGASRLPGLNRGLLALDFTRISRVELFSTGAGHNLINGWRDNGTATFGPVGADGVRTAAFGNVTVQAGPRRIFLAQIYDDGTPGEVQQELWGVADVPASGPVVIEPYTTPTAKIFRELLLTSDARRATQVAIADVQALVDRLLNTNRSTVPFSPYDASKPMLSPMHLVTAPVALAIANGAKDGAGVHQPFVVPTPSAENRLDPAPARQGKVTIKVLDHLGQPLRASATITIDDPLTEMIHASAPPAIAEGRFESVPVSFVPHPVKGLPLTMTWTATVVDALGRKDAGTFTLMDQQDRTIYLSMPLRAQPERLLGGKGAYTRSSAIGTPMFGNFPLSRLYAEPRGLTVRGSALYFNEGSALRKVDYALGNPEVEQAASEVCYNLDHDEYGNKLLGSSLNRILIERRWKEDPTNPGAIIADDGRIETFIDCNALSGWSGRTLGDFDYDPLTRKAYVGATGALFEVDLATYTVSPSTASSFVAVTHNGDVVYRSGYAFVSNWQLRTDGNPPDGWIHRYNVLTKALETVVRKQSLHPTRAVVAPGLSVRAQDYNGGVIRSMTLDTHGNLYFTACDSNLGQGSGLVCRVANVLTGDDASNEWVVTWMRLAGDSGLGYDPVKNDLYFSRYNLYDPASTTDDSWEGYRVKLE